MRLNVTYAGQSHDFDVDGLAELGDDDVRRVAMELIGGPNLSNFVVDRLTDRDGEPSIYVRPKVPFGGEF